MIPAMKFPPFPSQLGPLQKGAAVLVRKWKREVAMFLNQVPSTRCFLEEDAGQPQQPPAWTMEEAVKIEDAEGAEEKESSGSTAQKKSSDAEGIKIVQIVRDPTEQEIRKFSSPKKAEWQRHVRSMALYDADMQLWISNQAVLRALVYACPH